MDLKVGLVSKGKKHARITLFTFLQCSLFTLFLMGGQKLERFQLILGNPRSSSPSEESQKHKMVLHAMWNVVHTTTLDHKKL